MAGTFTLPNTQYGYDQTYVNNSPWQDQSQYDPTTAQKFNYNDLMGGNYNYDDLLKNIYGTQSLVNGSEGGPEYKPWSPSSGEDQTNGIGAGFLNGLGNITGSGYTTGTTRIGGLFGAEGGQDLTTYSNPTSLFLDNLQNGGNTSASNYNYSISKDPVTGKAIATPMKRYEDDYGSLGSAIGQSAKGLGAFVGALGTAGLGPLATAGAGAAAAGDTTGAFDMAGSAGTGLGFGGADVGAADGLGGITYGGSASGGGFGGLGEGSKTISDLGGVDTGAFDLGGSTGGELGSGGYSSGLQDAFGAGAGNTGAFDLGGTLGGTAGSGAYNPYLGDTLGNAAGTGAMDMTGSQGAGLGFGGSNSTYGLSNLLSDLKGGYNTLSGLNSTLKSTTGLSGTQLATGLYDAYAKNKMSQNAGKQADALANLYGPNSPYAQQMAETLARRDSALGRNSQYGPRAAQLAAALTQAQSGVLQSSAYTNARNAQTNDKLGRFNSLIASGAANQIANTIAKNTPQVITGLFNSLGSLF